MCAEGLSGAWKSGACGLGHWRLVPIWSLMPGNWDLDPSTFGEATGAPTDTTVPEYGTTAAGETDWCPGRDSNPHGLRPLPPQSSVSTNSTTWALLSPSDLPCPPVPPVAPAPARPLRGAVPGQQEVRQEPPRLTPSR